MPDAPEQLTLSKDGQAVSVPVNQAADLLTRGYKVETPTAQHEREEGELHTERDPGIATSTALGLLRGASMGGFDAYVRGVGGEDAAREVRDIRDYHPAASFGGELAGMLAPAALSGGASLAGEGLEGAEALGAGSKLFAATPAGMTAKLGSKIAGLGEGAGFLGRTAATAASGAAEGAVQGAGSYISDVALGDKDLSADGFMGAMGKGALWGGVAAGSLSVASDGLVAARKLFPKGEVTREAAQQAEEDAVREVSSAVDDGNALETRTRDRLRQIREEKASLDLETKKKLDEVAVQRAKDIAEHDTLAAKSKAEAAAARAERAKNPPARKVRRAMGGGEEAATETASETAGDAGEFGPGVSEDAAQAGDHAAPGGAAEETTGNAATLLERQLKGTQEGLDAGMSLSDIAAQRPKVIGNKATHIEDGLNEEIAKTDPEAKKLVESLGRMNDAKTEMSAWLDKYGKGGSVGKFERNQASRDYAAGLRSEKPGYYSSVPEGEGNAGLARGREYKFRGSDAERDAADEAINSKVQPEERARIDSMFDAKKTARDIVDAPKEAPAAEGDGELSHVDDKVKEALGAKPDDINEDITKSADTISKYEAAHADMAEALGQMAPQSSQARAQAFREAQKASEDKAAQAASRTGEKLEKEVMSPEKKGLFERALKLGDAIEALHMIGVPVPDPRNIPVIGPVLSMFLKARVIGKAFKRFGGKVGETAETTIASKAAATKQRAYEAIDRLLDVGAKATRAAATAVAAPAAALAHTLFDDGQKRPAKKGDLEAAFHARSDELVAAQQPGAVREAVEKRIRTSDPTVLDAIVAGQQRKLQYLYETMPKQDMPPAIGNDKVIWMPNKLAMASWSRRVAAAEDPAGVLERAAAGQRVSIEEAETLKQVYPSLFAEAQKKILEGAANGNVAIPRARRVMLSALFDIPLEVSMRPDFSAFLQKGPAPSSAPPPQPKPTLSADIHSAARTDPSMRNAS